ncbi:unnamed protein product [Musa hybrid cultivar]
MKMGNLTCFSVTDMRYKTLGAEVGTNDQDIRLQDHKNGSVWDHHEAWGHFENAKEPMCDQCYLEPITRCSVVVSSCTNALSIHTGPMFQFMHVQPAGHRMPYVECLLPD